MVMKGENRKDGYRGTRGRDGNNERIQREEKIIASLTIQRKDRELMGSGDIRYVMEVGSGCGCCGYPVCLL